jgi:hypothetical protein
MKRLGFWAAAFVSLASVAHAQQAATIDPRVAGPMVQALQAQLGFQQAVMRATQEDQAKKDADLAEWFKGWFGDKPETK